MLKQTLLIAGALSLTTSAFALEVTHPFYGPAKGQVASTTSYDFLELRDKQKNEGPASKSYQNIISEKLSYGILDTVSLDAQIGNTWTKDKGETGDETETTHRDIDWALGSTWNALTGATKLQVSASYAQEERRADGENHGTYKAVTAGAKLGQTIGIYTPYIGASVEKPLWQSKFGDHHTKYSARAAVYAYCPRSHVAVDTGFTGHYDGTSQVKSLNYDLEVSYLFTDNVSLSAYGTYTLNGKFKEFEGAGKESYHFYDKGLGLRLRAAF